MHSKTHRSIARTLPKALLVATILGIGLLYGTPVWAGPYLHVRIEISKARSQAECENFAAKALHSLAQKGHLHVDAKNKRLGFTKDTTLFVDCIFAGKNEKGHNQWIYYISAASTNLDESEKLRKLVATTLGKIKPID